MIVIPTERPVAVPYEEVIRLMERKFLRQDEGQRLVRISEERADERLTWRPGACHCQSVMFEVALTRKLTITLCNCGICHQSGHQELLVSEDRFRIVRGLDHLKEYRFGGREADHTFCVVCGVTPFYRPRSHPVGFFSVNARCVDIEFACSVEWVPFDGQNWADSVAAGLHRATE